jgi:hypothetical protein
VHSAQRAATTATPSIRGTWGTRPLAGQTTVVFTVTGGDQDQIGNFTIDRDGTATFDKETSISGPEGADLRATVSRVMSSR